MTPTHLAIFKLSDNTSFRIDFTCDTNGDPFQRPEVQHELRRIKDPVTVEMYERIGERLFEKH